MTQGNLIVLNGTSSSGKTSIARALQEQWPKPLLYLALDTAIAMMPVRYTGAGAMAAEGYALVQRVDDGGRTIVDYLAGPHGKALNMHLGLFAAALCADGYDVVLDHVIVSDETMVDLAAHTAAENGYLIAVLCQQIIAEKRESARGDRMVGLVAGQIARVHTGLRDYDLSVDSSQSTSTDLATRIVRFVKSGPPSAMGGLRVVWQQMVLMPLNGDASVR